MLHRHWRINIVRNHRANNYFVIVLHRFGTEIYVFMQGDRKSIAMKLIYPMLWQQFNILRLFLIKIFRTKMIKFLTMNPQMMMISIHAFRTQQNTPIISKDFLRALPHCPIIHWASQMCNYPTLFLSMFNSFQTMEGEKLCINSL
jgi:hypothetical protein